MFNVNFSSICIGNTQLFSSVIRKIEYMIIMEWVVVIYFNYNIFIIGFICYMNKVVQW